MNGTFCRRCSRRLVAAMAMLLVWAAGNAPAQMDKPPETPPPAPPAAMTPSEPSTPPVSPALPASTAGASDKLAPDDNLSVATKRDGPAYPISHIELRYEQKLPHQPTIADLMKEIGRAHV